MLERSIKRIVIFCFVIILFNFQNLIAQTYATGQGFVEHQSSSAYVVQRPWGADNIIHWPSSSVNVKYKIIDSLQSLSQTQVIQAVQNSMNAWNGVTTAEIYLNDAGSTTQNGLGFDWNNIIYFALDDDPYWINNSYDQPAKTIWTFNENEELLDVDILVNGKNYPENSVVNWFIGQEGEDIPTPNHRDVREVITHELGHFLSLFHVSNPSSVMNSKPKEILYTLGEQDRFGVSYVYVGNIISDKTLPSHSNNHFDFGLKIPAGVTVTFDQGTTYLFDYGTSCVVYGNVIANGSSGSIIIKAGENSSTWGGMIFNPGSSSSINNCTIQDATYGIYSNAAYVDISNTNIIDCNYGIYLYRTNYGSSQPDINNCNIYKSSYNGSGVGIYCNYSSPIILNTEVYNYYTGVGTIYNSSPLLGHYTATGNNYLHNNYKNLHTISSSNPFLGSTSYGGYNTLQYYLNYNIVAQTNCNLIAENNYWGTTQSSAIANGMDIYGGCSVDYEPFLTWNPNGRVVLPNVASSKTKNPGITSVATDLKSVQDLILSNKIDEALAICNQVLQKNKDTESILYALDLLWQIERIIKLQKGNENVDLFSSFRVTKSNTLVAGYANLIYTIGQQSNRNISLDNVLFEYGTSDIIEKGVIYSKFMYYLNEERNKEKAEEQYQILAEKYPDDPITAEAWFQLNGGSLNKKQSEFNNESVLNSDETPTNYALIGNYPNPFNPSTTIKYELPEKGHVVLKVFDILGNEVAELVNEFKNEGSYTIRFDAGHLSSGLYILTIRVNGFSATKKMVYLK